jgi:hypothetical protein
MRERVATRRGGQRPGAGRKPAGRVQYVTRLHPETIKTIKACAEKRGVAECEIVEEAIGKTLKGDWPTIAKA